MTLRNVGIVYRKELLDSLRDRRTLISMVAVPVLLMPALILGMGAFTAKMVGEARKAIPKIMILGGEDSPRLLQALRDLDSIEIVPANPDYTNQISAKIIRAAIKVPEGFDAALGRGDASTIEIFVYEGEMKSGFAAQNVQQFLRDYREKIIQERLQARNLPSDLLEPFEIQRRNVAPPKKVAGNLLGGILPYTVILLSVIGAMYPAMDLTAGEKERGTMETILCSPVPRGHLVLGKFLTVLTTSIATSALSIGSMGVTFAIAKGFLAGLGGSSGKTLALSIDLSALLVVFVMVLPVVVLFSAAQLAIALFAKSFKEAQSYLSPMMFVVIVPAMMSMLPGLELNWVLSLVPILNTSLVCKEILAGDYNWGFIGLIFLSTSIYAAVALWLAVKLFNREEVVFRV